MASSSSSSSDPRRNHCPIKTVVVLVQENRSFDHMLGWMKTLNPEINGVTGSESNPMSTSDPESSRIHFTDSSSLIQPDPGHSFEAVFEQIYGTQFSNKTGTVVATRVDVKTLDPFKKKTGTLLTKPEMSGFVQQGESVGNGMGEVVMSGFRPDLVPVFRDLVTEFAVCDRWFASVPTLTQPNRLFVHSATSYGAVENTNEMLVKGYPQKTIFESLEENGFSFGVYYQYPPSTLLFRNLRKLKYIDNFHLYDLKFEKHCKEGKLPNYVVIEQRFFETKFLAANDDHPPHDVSEGQNFVKKIYEALRSSPQWNEILFVIIYDEHGGFYDHVAPPGSGVPNPDGLVSPDPFKFEFDRLGVRVPAILISPWIERGTVLHGPSGPFSNSEFEHSSIPATLKKIFNLKDFLTKRDAWAGTFEVVLNRTIPRTDCPVTLSEPVKQRSFEPIEENKLSEFQQELVQLAAALNGDHKKDILPKKLVETMNVTEAVNYVEGAYKMFLDECEKAKRIGDDGSHIPLIGNSPERRADKSLVQKIFSCLVCDH